MGHRTVLAGPGARGVREPADPSRSVHTMHNPERGHTRERGQPVHPQPFGIRAVPGSGSKTHSCSLMRNGTPAVRLNQDHRAPGKLRALTVPPA
jgi:hypothetical protein